MTTTCTCVHDAKVVAWRILNEHRFWADEAVCRCGLRPIGGQVAHQVALLADADVLGFCDHRESEFDVMLHDCDR